ncbi:hypothetical protein ACF3OE_12525 (plasmid) [Capnocytophaga canis]|uniref:hypothetical protein n=1 Tax=Capnocytophaga canis TaxID=1848903 RepID=UPI00370DB352
MEKETQQGHTSKQISYQRKVKTSFLIIHFLVMLLIAYAIYLLNEKVMATVLKKGYDETTNDLVNNLMNILPIFYTGLGISLGFLIQSFWKNLKDYYQQ